MAYKVIVNQPNLGKGTEVFIDGLGTFKNGDEAVVSNAQADQFRNAHGRVNDEGQWEQGPTLGQAFGEGSGITIERVSEKEAPGQLDTSVPEPAPDGTVEPMESTAKATTAEGKKGGK